MMDADTLRTLALSFFSIWMLVGIGRIWATGTKKPWVLMLTEDFKPRHPDERERMDT